MVSFLMESDRDGCSPHRVPPAGAPTGVAAVPARAGHAHYRNVAAAGHSRAQPGPATRAESPRAGCSHLSGMSSAWVAAAGPHAAHWRIPVAASSRFLPPPSFSRVPHTPTLVPRLTSRSQGAKSLQRLQELMRESIASNKAALELCEVRGGRSKRRRRAAWLPAQRTKASARFLLPLTASPLHPLPHGRRSSTMRRSFVAAWGKRPSPGCS